MNNIQKLKNLLADIDIQIYANDRKLDERVDELITLARKKHKYSRWIIDLADYLFLIHWVVELRGDAEYQHLVQEHNRLVKLSEKTFKELRKELKKI